MVKGGGNGPGGHQQHDGAPPGDPPPVPGLPGGAEASGGSFRGLDSGLAKAAPNAHGLCQRNYRAYRRRLDLFSRQCLRRGREVAVEGALLVMSQLQDSAWDATEGIDYDDVELAENPFDVIRQTLDLLYQHEDEVELPERCQEFFEQFKREKGEELQAYIVRHQTMLRKLKELQVEVPTLAGWHMLRRAGMPRWTHPQMKALCGGEVNVKNLAKAMTRMLGGGDSKPSLKDSALRGGDINMADTYEDYEFEDEAYYQHHYDDEEHYVWMTSRRWTTSMKMRSRRPSWTRP